MPDGDVSVANAARYDQTAEHYSAGRLNYSAKLIEHVATTAGLGPDSVVLDLGCGPGTIANEIAKYCGHVIAVDPSEAMLEAGRRGAPDNVTYIKGSSDDLSFIDRPLQLVTFGRSFHWMDRVQTLKVLDELVAPDGLLAFLYVSPLTGKTPDHYWYDALRKAAQRLSDMDKTGEDALKPGAEREEFLLLRSTFSDVSMYSHYESFDWSFERVTAWLLSRYGTSAGDTSQRLAQIEAELKQTLEPFGEGPWASKNMQRSLYAKRPK